LRAAAELAGLNAGGDAEAQRRAGLLGDVVGLDLAEALLLALGGCRGGRERQERA
jgi:hypothetical protein